MFFLRYSDYVVLKLWLQHAHWRRHHAFAHVSYVHTISIHKVYKLKLVSGLVNTPLFFRKTKLQFNQFRLVLIDYQELVFPILT